MTSSPVLGNGFYASKYNMVRRDSYNQFTPSEINNYEYTLSDVYDDAAIIGSELEKIINNFGSEILKDLMPKVISVLELLESMTINKEKENDQINELKMRINSLEMEKTARNNEREKFEKELEEIDEKWKQETSKLITMINKLKDENKRLNEYLDQNKSTESKQSELLVIKQEELDYIRQIKEENYRLKETIRLKDREIEQKNSDHEGLLGQIERLNSTLLSLRRKQILAQNQIEKMVKSKAEIECSLTEKEHQLNLIRERLKTKNLPETIDKKEPLDTIDKEAMSSQEKLSKDITNLLIFDANDPNRPRFTLRELQKVLREKNELTIKLDQTQDELEQLKCQDNLCGEVQGPINREPEEKLDPTAKQSQSGIRRLYVADSNNILVVVDLFLNTNLYAPLISYTEHNFPDRKQPEYRNKLFLANLSFVALLFNIFYIYFCFNNFLNIFILLSKFLFLISRLYFFVLKHNFVLISSIGFLSLINVKFSIWTDKYLFRFFKFKSYLFS